MKLVAYEKKAIPINRKITTHYCQRFDISHFSDGPMILTQQAERPERLIRRQKRFLE